MDWTDILEKIKFWSETYSIDENAYDAITYDMKYAEERWLNRYANAKTNSELLNMVRCDFPAIA